MLMTDPKSHITTKISDVLSQLRRVTEPNGAVTDYTFDHFGNRLTARDAAGNATTSVYNGRGMITASTDPDRGTITYEPNAFGELRKRTDAKSQIVTYGAYDVLGRPTTRTAPEGTTTWVWGTSPAAKNVGRLASISHTENTYGESYAYDAAGRVQSITYSQDEAYAVDYTYNQLGAVDTITYPTSTSGVRFKIKRNYDTRGYWMSVTDYTNNVVGAAFWQLTSAASSVDAQGNIIDETFGNGMRTQHTYDALTGELNTRKTGTGGTSAMQNMSYQWDKNGNLQERKDLNQSNLTELFEYDSRNVLQTVKLNGVVKHTLTVNNIGNITIKTASADNPDANVGTYVYGDPAHKHAVTAAGSNTYTYDANGNMITQNGATISWTSYDMPSAINGAGGNSSQFSYGTSRNRWKQTAVFGSGPSAGTETTIYVGGLLEKVTRGAVSTYRHYIEGATGVAAVYNRDTSGANTVHYLTRDHLGSVDGVVSAAGVVQGKYSFDPFGLRRSPVGWTGTWSTAEQSTAQNSTRRGFTFHEQLDNLNLTHMNGRVYSPVVGRFLSADPFEDANLGPQGLNRYSYVGNNPGSYSDSSGFGTDILTYCHGEGQCFFFRIRSGLADAFQRAYARFITPVAEDVSPPRDSPQAENQKSNQMPTNNGSLADAKRTEMLAAEAAAQARNQDFSRQRWEEWERLAVSAKYWTLAVAGVDRQAYATMTDEKLTQTVAERHGEMMERLIGAQTPQISQGVPYLVRHQVSQMAQSRATEGVRQSVASAARAILATPKVGSQKLQNIINDVYKGTTNPNRVGTGTTADAIRHELATGRSVGGRFHGQKGTEYARALENWLRANPNAPYRDRVVAQSVLDDLRSALGGGP
jgi:RHS repeat-associated protein